ncbi:MAG: hypothetical protein ABL921_05430 [Pirellula sp.]
MTRCIRWKPLRSLKFLPVLLPVLITSIGCDRSPDLQVPPIPALPADVVGGTMRDQYVWRATTVPPTQFRFPQQLDRDQLTDAYLNRKKEASGLDERPEWMSREIWVAYRRYVEPYREPEELLDLDDAKTGNAIDVCLDSTGRRMWTVGNQIIEWSVDSGTEVRRFPCPIKNPSKAFFEAKSDTILIHNDESIVRISTGDGAPLHQWNSDIGKIVRVVVAQAEDVVGIVANSNRLYALENRLRNLRACVQVNLANSNIAIHPEGDWITGVTNKGMLKWRLQNQEPSIQEIPEPSLIKESVQCICDRESDYWIDPLSCLRPRFSFGTTNTVRTELPRTLRFPGVPSAEPLSPLRTVLPIVVEAVNASCDGEQDWIVAITQRGDGKGRVGSYLQELSFDERRLGSDSAWRIPYDSFEWLGGDSSCARVVFRVGDRIKVLERQILRDPFGDAFFHKLANEFADGSTKKVEDTLKLTLPSQSDPYGQSRNQLLIQFIEKCSKVWTRLEQSPNSTELLAKLEREKASGSPLATLSAQSRQSNMNGRRIVSVGSTAQLNSIQGPKPSFSSDPFWALCNDTATLSPTITMSGTLVQVENAQLDYEALMRRSIATDPAYVDTLIRFCNTANLTSRMSEAGSLIHAIAERFPEPLSEEWYARTAVSLLNKSNMGSIALASSYGLDPLRIVIGALPLLESHSLTQDEVQALIGLSKLAAREDLMKLYAAHLIERFVSADPMLLLNYAKETIIVVKREMIPADHRYQGKAVFP